MTYTKKILANAKAVIDLNVRRYAWEDDDSYAKSLREAAADLMDFLRDHRSRDGYSINVECEYREVCLYCGYETEDDPETGEPLCCGRAILRWEAERYCQSALGWSGWKGMLNAK